MNYVEEELLDGTKEEKKKTQNPLESCPEDADHNGVAGTSLLSYYGIV